MAFVDTNIILRWLLNDHPELSEKATLLVSTAPARSLIITDVIVAEIIYVLNGQGRDRQQTAEALLLVGRTEAFKYENEELVLEIIYLFNKTRLDYADCYLLARARREKQTLETFDVALNKLNRST